MLILPSESPSVSVPTGSNGTCETSSEGGCQGGEDVAVDAVVGNGLPRALAAASNATAMLLRAVARTIHLLSICNSSGPENHSQLRFEHIHA